MSPAEAQSAALMLQTALLAASLAGLPLCRRLPGSGLLLLFFANLLSACAAIYFYISSENAAPPLASATLEQMQQRDLVQGDSCAFLALSLLCACAGVACCLLAKAGKSRP
ncbi:MAG: hypothetical protein RL095_2730 [Verrucomicrobiota bacterium]|jgi:hypothetical protein